MGTIAATQLIENIRNNLTENVVSLTDPTLGDKWTNKEVLEALNKAKDRAWDIIRRVRGDYFIKTGATITLTPGVKETTLASDFRQLVGLKCTTAGYEGVRFRAVGMDAREWQTRDAEPNNSSASNTNEFIYTIVGDNIFKLADFPTMALTITYDYIAVLPDFTLSASSTVDINDELREYIEGYATMKLFGKTPEDKRDAFWIKEVMGEGERPGNLEVMLTRSVEKRNIRESEYVEAFDPY